MKIALRSLLSLFGLTLSLAGCTHDATCEDTLMEPSDASLPSAWKDRGLALPKGALVCKAPSDHDIHFVERTTDSPEVRAKQYADAMMAAGFTEWKTSSGDEKTDAQVVIHLQRGDERLVFNVYRVDPPNRKVHPALAAGFAVGAPRADAKP